MWQKIKQLLMLDVGEQFANHVIDLILYYLLSVGLIAAVLAENNEKLTYHWKYVVFAGITLFISTFLPRGMRLAERWVDTDNHRVEEKITTMLSQRDLTPRQRQHLSSKNHSMLTLIVVIAFAIFNVVVISWVNGRFF